MQNIPDYLSENDEILKNIIQSTKIKINLNRIPEEDVYLSLLESIVSQQLSIKASDTIFKRFLHLFENQYPNPEKLVLLDTTALRSIGLSAQKASYVQNVAQFKIDKGLDFETLSKMTDEEVIEYLIVIKGVGKWTIEMLLMFALNRPDVFPIDDLVIRNTMIRLYQVESQGKELYKHLTKIADVWKPHRTTACRYLWASKDQV